MDEDVMQKALDAGDLGGTPSEVRAIEFAYEAARAQCARALLETPLLPAHVHELVMSWLTNKVRSGEE